MCLLALIAVSTASFGRADLVFGAASFDRRAAAKLSVSAAPAPTYDGRHANPVWQSGVAVPAAPGAKDRHVGPNSALSRTERNADRSYTTTLTARPVQWQDARGEWRAFVNDVRAAPAEEQAAGFSHVARIRRHATDYSAGGATVTAAVTAVSSSCAIGSR